MKNLCKRRSATSSCEWTNPSGPQSEGTLETLHPCLHSAPSHSSAFSMCLLAHLCLAVHTVPLSQAATTAHVAVEFALQRFCTTTEHAVFHQRATFGWWGHCLWKIHLLVSWISAIKPTTACSTSSAVGEKGSNSGAVQFLKDLTQSSFFFWVYDET